MDPLDFEIKMKPLDFHLEMSPVNLLIHALTQIYTLSTSNTDESKRFLVMGLVSTYATLYCTGKKELNPLDFLDMMLKLEGSSEKINFTKTEVRK